MLARALAAFGVLTLTLGCSSHLGSPDGDREPVGRSEAKLAGPETVSLAINRDTAVRQSAASKNFGSATTLDVNRALFGVDQGALSAAVGSTDFLVSAKLVLPLSNNQNRRAKRDITLHRLLKDWTESGATWLCSTDTNLGNGKPDCSVATAWNMQNNNGVFAATATATATVPATSTGTVELDVTTDVKDFLSGASSNFGWLVKGPNPSEFAEFMSREGASPPRLELGIQRCSAALCDDGNACTVESCSGTGTCVSTPAADGTSCSDGNACTTTDSCVAGVCAPGAAVACAATDGCHPASCDPGTGACVTTSACALHGVGSISPTARDGLAVSPIILEDGTPNNQVSAFGSAIAYTGVDNLYVATPDRGPNNGATSYTDRYYLIDISLEGGSVTPHIVGASTLNKAPGVPFIGLNTAFDAANQTNSRRFDPEGVRVSPTGTLFISDEYGPFLYEFAANGDRIRALSVPSRFLVANPGVEGAELPPANTAGRQVNRGMEGLALSPDGSKLYGIMQNPLIQDGGLDAANTRVGLNDRILEVDTASGATRELLYQLSDKSFGISEILAVNAHQFLVLERDGRAGTAAAFKRLFLIDIGSATDISSIASLPTTGTPAGVTPVTKTPFLDMLAPEFDLAGSTFPEKIEGVAFGPDRADGKHTLVITSDNDGIATNPSMFFVFTVDPAALPGFTAQTATFPSACSGVTCDAPAECHMTGICNPGTSTCTNPLQAAGTPCSNGSCDASGSCVACLAASECPGVDDACSARTCTSGTCGVLFAPEGTACGDSAECDGAGACIIIAPPVDVVVNEVESNGGSPGDWVELKNLGSEPADLTGHVFKDNDDSHAFVLPSGSVIAAGGYLVLETAAFGFGLGSPDAVRLFNPAGTELIDSFSWDPHAAVTYGRCPDGTGDFASNPTSTKGTANSCP